MFLFHNVPHVVFVDVYTGGMNLANPVTFKEKEQLANLQAKMDEASCGYKASLVKVDRTVRAEMRHKYLAGGFKYFLFSPLLGEMIQFD